MATGYTAPIADGEPISFREFALRCSRAMGVRIMERDDALDSKPPEPRTVDPRYREELERAKARHAEVLKTTDEQARALASAEFEAAHRSWQERQRDRNAKRERYEAMLAQVRAWTPPTKDHERFHEFMIEQLESSLKFDCGWDDAAPERETIAEWRASAIAHGERQISWAARYLAEEEERVRFANAWVEALLGSLPK